MRLLLDQGLARSTVGELSARGIVAEHVADLGLASATDSAILQEAQLQGAIVVTLDADFHRLLAANRLVTPSVIRIRIEGLKGAAMATLLASVIASTDMELKSGAAVSVTNAAIRVRLLPFGS